MMNPKICFHPNAALKQFLDLGQVTHSLKSKLLIPEIKCLSQLNSMFLSLADVKGALYSCRLNRLLVFGKSIQD